MLTLFGSVAVSIMLLSYWWENRSKWMVLVFAGGSALTSVYSGLAEVYPITVIRGSVVRNRPATLRATASTGKTGGPMNDYPLF